MKLRISSCKTVLFKDLTRFAPAWALYLIGLVMLLIPNVVYDQPITVARTLEEVIGAMGILNFLYAALCAQLLFGDLFQTRLCNALHAMPLKRGDWFFCHVVAGLSFSLVPNTVCALLIMPLLEEFWYLSALWLGAMTLQFVFFFGLAVLSMLCVGSRFAMVAVYGILNFLSVLVMWIVKTVVEPLLFGFYADAEPFLQFCPVAQLIVAQNNGQEYLCFERISDVWVFSGLGSGWIYLLILGGIGLVFGALALLLYRRRALESAGDFIAVRPLTPIFCVVYTLTVAALFGAVGELIMEEILYFFAVGFLVGYFTGQMLLRRTVKVFVGKVFLWCGIFAAAVFGCVIMLILDPFGYSRWTPEPSQVVSVVISNDKQGGGYGWPSDGPLQLDDPADIAAIVDVHREVTEKRGEYPNAKLRKVSLRISYTLQNGRQVTRVYESCVPAEPLAKFFSRPEYVLGMTENADAFVSKITKVEVEVNAVWGEAARELMKAVIADCEAGTMAQVSNYHDFNKEFVVAWLQVRLPDGAYRGISVYSGAENTVAWLKENYDLWGDENVKMEDYFHGK